MVVQGKGEGGGVGGQTEASTKIVEGIQEGQRYFWHGFSLALRRYGENALRTSRSLRGHVSYAPPPTPEPSTTSRKIRGGKPSNVVTLDRTPGAAWHRPPVSPTGGQRVKTGATGKAANKQQTDGEEARLGERCTRRKIVCSHGARAGESWRGEIGGTRSISGQERST